MSTDQRKGAKNAKAAEPTLDEVQECLRFEIKMYRDSYRENGMVRNPGALHTIACLRVAQRLCVKSQIVNRKS